jgi:hypothetical protein
MWWFTSWVSCRSDGATYQLAIDFLLLEGVDVEVMVWSGLLADLVVEVFPGVLGGDVLGPVGHRFSWA